MSAEQAQLAREKMDFRLLLAGRTVSAAGSAVTAVALPLVAVVDLGAGPLEVGLLAAAVWLPWLLLGLPAGVWVGRWPRRGVMVGCDLATAALLASVPVAGWCGVLTSWQLAAVALLAGAGGVFFQAAFQAHLPELVAAERLASANARLQGSTSLAQLVGPALAGPAAQAFGARSGLLADALTFLCSALSLLLLRTRPAAPPGGREEDGPLRTRIGAGFRHILRDPYLRAITAYGAAANLALTVGQSVLVLYLVRELRVEEGLLGPLTALSALGGAAGAALAGPVGRRWGSARGAVLVQLAAAPFAALVPLARPGAGVAPAVLGSGVLVAGVVAGNVVFVTFRQRRLPATLLPQVVTSAMALNHATLPLGALLGGAVAAAAGPRAALWLSAALLLGAAVRLRLGPFGRTRDLPLD
ncbi:MFS transporter [Kitasatospora phosalacinea]|uniref:MFS transporter n=1 Tax=Kitasatospora phosalacinea TaxID=2065 RepID=UPI0035DFAA4D